MRVASEPTRVGDIVIEERVAEDLDGVVEPVDPDDAVEDRKLDRHTLES